MIGCGLFLKTALSLIIPIDSSFKFRTSYRSGRSDYESPISSLCRLHSPEKITLPSKKFKTRMCGNYEIKECWVTFRMFLSLKENPFPMFSVALAQILSHSPTSFLLYQDLLSAPVPWAPWWETEVVCTDHSVIIHQDFPSYQVLSLILAKLEPFRHSSPSRYPNVYHDHLPKIWYMALNTIACSFMEKMAISMCTCFSITYVINERIALLSQHRSRQTKRYIW